MTMEATTAGIERPGVNPKWLKRRNTCHLAREEIYAKEHSYTVRGLEFYCTTGAIKGKKDNSYFGDTRKYKWKHLGRYLRFYATDRLYELLAHDKISADDSSTVASASLSTTAYSTYYLWQLVDLSREQHNLTFDATLMHAALGTVIGCEERSFLLARMMLRAIRTWFAVDGIDALPETRGSTPTCFFVLRLFADYLDEAPLIDGEAPTEPILVALLKHWRTPEEAELVPYCLAACDLHTHRIVGGETEEFLDSDWLYIPIEILLLFKLRTLLGLKNPEIDHPLMNGWEFLLRTRTDFEYDELIQRVHARMVADGFDEAAVIARYLPEHPLAQRPVAE